jgi:Uma2 family endonuclease
MSVLAPQPTDRSSDVYPETDGKPIAENTLQFKWITVFKGGIGAQFRLDPNVFVAGDLFWYPVEGSPAIRVAPDTMVVFGRPKGHRSSYLQWREDNIAPQVVCEVTSPGNTYGEMAEKLRFYDRFGVQEYYLFDPEDQELSGWQRTGASLEQIPHMDGWVSPRLGIRFELSAGELQVFGSDGRRFLTYVELASQLDEEKRARQQAEEQAARLAAKLRALGIDPEA